MPYSLGTLSFYAAGSSTPLAVYSNQALSISRGTAVTLDSAGRAGDVFLQNLGYKVVLADALGNQVWTADPVYASDFSTAALLPTNAGNPNGNVAGTAGTGAIYSSTIWDSTNSILYVCTTTGSASTAVWTAVNATTAAAVVPPPQGYLTPTSGTPIITADVIANTSLVYTSYVGNIVPIYNGASFTPTVFTEQTLTLVANHALNTIYDVYMFSNSGVVTIATGPAWTNSAAGTGARGTGAGTTQLSRISGLLVNTVQMTARNGATTYTVAANQGTYLGSIFIDAIAGQITCHRGYGQSRKWAIWNAYNRAPIYLKAGDSTASWTYASTTPRAANGNSANSLTTFCGLAEEIYDLRSLTTGVVSSQPSGTTATTQGGIGFNSTSAFSGGAGTQSLTITIATETSSSTQSANGAHSAPPSLGINTVTLLEASSATTTTFTGGEVNNRLSAFWRG